MSSDQNIPGIYNWCDRWCERCSFTQRCAVAQAEREDIDANDDLTNEDFWNKLSNHFAQITELLKTAAQEHGIDLEDVPVEEWKDIEKKQKQHWEDGQSHPLSILSKQYLKMADELLQSPAIEEVAEGHIQALEMGLQNPDEIKPKSAAFKDCLEVVRWYLFFIPVKCQRVMMEKYGDDAEQEEGPAESLSYNGTAKILLVALSRSISAWAMLLTLMPSVEDELIQTLATLQKLEKMVNQEFPDAQKFIRPGFDE